MSYILTHTGQKFHYDNPEGHLYSIEDIAHSLARQCRFVGHTRRFYSISEHSRFVAALIRDAGGSYVFQLLGLLHDLAEAYIGDMPTPLKQLFPLYKSIEQRILDSAIPQLIPNYMLPNVDLKHVDGLALTIEVQKLMPEVSNYVDWIGAIKGPGTECQIEKALAVWAKGRHNLDEVDETRAFLEEYYGLMRSVVGDSV